MKKIAPHQVDLFAGYFKGINQLDEIATSKDPLQRKGQTVAILSFFLNSVIRPLKTETSGNLRESLSAIEDDLSPLLERKLAFFVEHIGCLGDTIKEIQDRLVGSIHSILDNLQKQGDSRYGLFLKSTYLLLRCLEDDLKLSDTKSDATISVGRGFFSMTICPKEEKQTRQAKLNAIFDKLSQAAEHCLVSPGLSSPSMPELAASASGSFDHGRQSVSPPPG